MVASIRMNSPRLRRRRSWAQLAAVGSLLVGALAVTSIATAPRAAAFPEVVAERGIPSSLSAQFGPIVPLTGALASVMVAPTRSGADFYDPTQPTPLLGRFRTAGQVVRASAIGSTVFLFAGTEGVLALDASNPAAPAAVGAIGSLGSIVLGAAAPAGTGILAATDASLHFLAWDAVSGFSVRRTVAFSDGRHIAAIAAQGDSFLVISNRTGIPSRIFLTLYRLRAGAAAPDSIVEFAFNGHQALDVAWRGPTAFVAEGNLGILVVNVTSHSIVRSVPVLGTKLVQSVDANDSVVVAVAEGKTFIRFRRAGVGGDSLEVGPVRILLGEPAHARLFGDFAVAGTQDQLDVSEPDEVGRSLLEFISLSGSAEPSPVGGTGRVRRVAIANGLAYTADYTGGFRAYRAGGGDSSLVGLVAPSGNARPVDIAVDPSLPLVYLASGPSGLEIIRTVAPGSYALAAAATVPGLASAVAMIQPNLVAVAYRGSTPGVTLFQIDFNVGDSSVVATARGSVHAPLLDPRALAARDTVLYVADEVEGVVSIGFGNPDLPEAFGPPSNVGARDLDLAGTRLLVATRTRGLQIVDVTHPSVAILRGEFATPPLLGVTQNGSSAVLFLGEQGALVVDISSPSMPFARGPIPVPGTARDGAWIGDTLVVAASLGLERYTVSPGPVVVPALSIDLDLGGALPSARVSWAPVSLVGMVGLNLYRDLGSSSGNTVPPTGRRINGDLLPPDAVVAIDDSLTAGMTHRYRLEAFFSDGSSLQVAEGSVFVSSVATVGRVFPNPFRPGGASRASLSFRAPGGAGGVLTLRVCDVSGRVVREVRIATASGFGVVAWDGRDSSGRNVPSGIYYLHLTGPGLDAARRVALVR